jgi:hypothetical protein
MAAKLSKARVRIIPLPQAGLTAGFISTSLALPALP